MENGRKKGRAPHVTIEKVKNSPYWWIQYRWQGKQMKRSTRMRAKADAQAHAKTLQQRLSIAYLTGEFSEEFGDTVKVIPRSTPLPHEVVTLGAVLDLYRDTLLGMSERHRRVQGGRLKTLELLLGGRNRPALTITTPIVEEFITNRRRLGSSDTTIHNYVIALNKAFHLAVEQGLLKACPYKVKPPKARRFSDKVLPEEKASELFGKLDLSLAIDRAIALALATGIRTGDLMSVRWADISWAEGVLHVRTSKTGQAVQNPVPQHILDALKPCSVDGVLVCEVKHPSVAIPRRTEALIGEKWGLHSMRKRYCSSLANGGANLSIASSLMGHASVSTTAGYVHPSESAKRDAMGKIEYLQQKEGK
jgi:integrase